MMTRQEQIKALEREYALKRENDEADRDRRVQSAAARFPDIGALLAEGRDIVRESARLLSGGIANASEAAREMRLRAEDRDKRLAMALKAHGLAEDELSLRPDCPVCMDRGYIENTYPLKRCACFENELSRRMSMESAREQSFASFDLSLFPDTAPEGTGMSQRAVMDRVRRFLRDYAERFPDNDKPNIMLMGKSGLGKTFLLNCVAKALRDKGVPVLQVTAYRMFEAMRRRHRGMDEGRDAFDELIEAPCLILDDLGSEPMLNNVTIEYLFILLNERQLAGRPILAATNLSMSELKGHYNETIASRLLDVHSGVVITLSGSDLRTGH